MPEDNDVLVRRFMEENRRDGNQRVEPAARLIDSFRDKIRREAVLEDILVFKRIVPLRKRHGPRVKPAVDDFRHTVHNAAALRALGGNLIDVRTMKLDVIRTVIAHGLQLFNGAHRVLMATCFILTFPDVKRCAPITVAADAPILDMLNPVAKAPLADRLWNPVDRIIVGDEFILDCRHADKPRFARIVEQRRIASPAMRITMCELGRLKELSLFLKILQNHRVGFFDKDAREIRIFRHLAAAVDKAGESNVVLLADAVIVFAKGRRHMDDARTIFRRDIVVIRDEKRLLALQLAFCIGVKRLVFAVLERFALHLFENFTVAFHAFKDGIDKRFCEIIDCICHANLYIIDVRVDAEGEIRWKRPRRRRPCEEIGIFALDLELDDSGTLGDILISLGNFVRRKRRAAARAVRNDLIAFIKELLLPNFLQRPPLRFDKIVLIRNVWVFHIRPEADDVGELLPHPLILPNRRTAILDKRLDAIVFDLFLAIDADRLFNL